MKTNHVLALSVCWGECFVRMILATVSLGGSLQQRLEAAKRAGFDGIEFFYHDCLSSGLTFAEIGRMTRDLGLLPVSLQPVRGFEGDPDDAYQAGRSAIKTFFDDALELGVPLVGICANEKPSACEPKRAAEILYELADIAEAHNLLLGYESLCWSYRINTLADAWEAVRLADHPSLGVTIDAFHFGMRHEDTALLDKIPINKIAAVQVSDSHMTDGLPMIEISRHHRVYPGEGVFPVRDMIDRLLKRGYRDGITLELFSDTVRAQAPAQAAEEALIAMKKLVQQS